MDAAGQHTAKSTIQQGVEEFENHHDEVKPVNKAERITIRDRGTFRQGNEVNIDTFNQTIQAPPASPSRKDVLGWLSSLNFKTTYEDELERWQPGTLTSLHSPGEFQDWVGGRNQLLWCHGDGGVGKTVLVSVIIQYLEELQKVPNANIGLAYLFCNHSAFGQQDSALDHSAINLVASLVQQLAQQSKELPIDVSSLYDKHNAVSPATRPRIKEFDNVLLQQVKTFKKVYIIVDALDECREDDGETQIRSRLLQSLNCLRPWVNILITSRDVSLESIGMDSDIPVVAWTFSTTDEDIGAYVDRRIEGNQRLKKHSKVENLETEIKEGVVKQAAGMFLLARLHMGRIEQAAKSRQGAVRKIKEALADLPSILDDTYEILLRKVWTQIEEDVEIARQVFTWIIFGKEATSLTISMVQRALYLEENKTMVDERDFISEDDIVSICHGLVRIDRQSERIRFVHYTAEEYFSNSEIRQKYFPTAQETLATVCINQLSLKTYKKELDLPLYQYASRNWGIHAQPVEDNLQAIISLFISDIEKLRASFKGVILMLPASWIQSPDTGESPGLESHYLSIQPLHVAAYFGLEVLFSKLLKQGTNIESKDSLGWTSIRWAIVGKSDVITTLLIEHGADTLSVDRQGQPTLFWTLGTRSTKQYFQSVSMHGGKVVFGDIMSLKPGQSFKSAWGKSVEVRTSDNILSLLIKKLQDVNFQRLTDGRTVISVAAENWQWPTVKLLLSLGAKIDIKDNLGMTPLLWALQNPRHTLTINQMSAYKDVLLHIGKTTSIHSGSELEIYDNEYTEEEIEPAIHMLIGEDLEARDTTKRTALSLAAESRLHTVVATLLERGADPNSPDGDMLTPLHWACGLPRFESVIIEELSCYDTAKVRLGNDKQQSITFKGESRHTGKRFETSVQLLLRHRADTSLKTKDGRTPLSFAKMDALESIIDALEMADDSLNDENASLDSQGVMDSTTHGNRLLVSVDEQKLDFSSLLLSMLDCRGSFKLHKVKIFDGAQLFVRSTAVIEHLQIFGNSQVLLDDRPIVAALEAFGQSQLLVQSTSRIQNICAYDQARAFVQGDSETGSILLYESSRLFVQGRATINYLKTLDTSIGHIAGQSIVTEIETSDSAQLRIEGTAMIVNLANLYSSVVLISGNSQVKNIKAEDSTTIQIEGTAHIDTLTTLQSSTISISGNSWIEQIVGQDSSRLRIDGSAIKIDSLTTLESSAVFISGVSEIGQLKAQDSTRLLIEGTALIDSLRTFESSIVFVSGNSQIKLIEARDSTRLEIEGQASIDDLTTLESSTILLSGNSLIRRIKAQDSTRLRVEGTASIGDLKAFESSAVLISGKSLIDLIEARDSSRLQIEGTVRYENLAAKESSLIVLAGDWQIAHANAEDSSQIVLLHAGTIPPQLLHKLEVEFPQLNDLAALSSSKDDLEATREFDLITFDDEASDQPFTVEEDWDWITELVVKM